MPLQRPQYLLLERGVTQPACAEVHVDIEVQARLLDFAACHIEHQRVEFRPEPSRLRRGNERLG